MRIWGFWDEAKHQPDTRPAKEEPPALCQVRDEQSSEAVLWRITSFGSWQKALVAVGIKIPKYARVRLAILRVLDDAVYGHSRRDVPEPLNRRSFITSVACIRLSLQPEQNGLHDPRPGLETRSLGPQMQAAASIPGGTSNAAGTCRR